MLYLVKKFEKEFINYGKDELSETYTHNLLEKRIKKSKIRIQNVLDEYKEYTHELAEIHARDGIRNLIIERLENRKLPLLDEPEQLASSYFHDDLQEKLKKCFKPNCGNSEYWFGLAPIWEDNFAAYYFAFRRQEEAKAMVLIVERAKAPLVASDGIPYYQSDSPVIEWFEQIDAKEKFLEWFNDEKVKENLIWHLFFRIFYRFLEHKKELTEKDYKQSHEYLKDIIELCTKYYGIFYPIEEVMELSKKKELECVERYNLIEEEKQRRREIIEKMFPLPIDNNVEKIEEST